LSFRPGHIAACGSTVARAGRYVMGSSLRPLSRCVGRGWPCRGVGCLDCRSSLGFLSCWLAR
jgi:hypothetical protein